MTVDEAIGSAFSIIEELAGEVREVVDNASGTNFENTQRIQTLGATADELEQYCEAPSYSEAVGEFKVTVSQFNKKRPSRADRRDEASSYVGIVMDRLQERLDEIEDLPEAERPDGEADEAQALMGELENAQSSWDGVEFPGLYG